MSQPEEIAALIAKIEHLTANPPQDIDDSTRIKLRESAKSLSIAMEIHSDTVHRIGYSALQLHMARVGRDSKLWTVLTESDGPMTLAQIAEKTGFDPILLKRVLRFYQAWNMLAQPENDAYVATNVTRALAGPSGIAIEYFATDGVLGKPFDALPRFLKGQKYQNPSNPVDSAWQEGYETKEHPFLWMRDYPEKLDLFSRWLQVYRIGLPTWLDGFPFDQLVAQNTDKDTVIFVDVGSASGSQSIGLRERFPDVPGRIVMQDIPQVIEAVKPSHGIEAQVYDFFTPQPVKGARAYYLRMIIHDWPDEQAIAILQNQMSAMSDDSVILIDDMVLPEKGATWRSTLLDLTMMATLSALERSEDQWYALLEKAGLDVVKIWKYAEETDDGIIVAKKKKVA